MSGWISTSGSYSLKYGMVDFRAKMSAGQGLRSGLWPASANGDATEIDVQEMLLGYTDSVYGSLHDSGRLDGAENREHEPRAPTSPRASTTTS